MVTGPVWLQVRRQGDTCELLHSTDGLDWQLTGNINQALTMSRAGWLAAALLILIGTPTPAAVLLDVTVATQPVEIGG